MHPVLLGPSPPGPWPPASPLRRWGLPALCLGLLLLLAGAGGRRDIAAMVTRPLWRVPAVAPLPAGRPPLDVGGPRAMLPGGQRGPRPLSGLWATAQDVTPGSLVEREDTQARAFERWASQLGVTASKLGLASFDGLDGVLATDNIKQGETIIALPKKAILSTAEFGEDNPFPFIADEYWRRAHYTTRLALKLALERQKGPASPFAPYAAVLPTEYPTPFFWTDAEVAEVQYAPMQEAVAAQRVEWREQFESLQSSSPECPVTWEDFVWALSAVYSRSYRGELTPLVGPIERVVQHCLLPWVDMINSRSSTPTILNWLGCAACALARVVWLAGGASSGEDDPANSRPHSRNIFLQRLELRAGEAFAKGQQVWLSYGKENDDLLQRYGYVERDNPGDSYCLRGALDTILAETPSVPADVVQARLPQLQKLGLLSYLDSVCVTKEAPYLRSMQALRMVLVPEDTDPVLAKDKVLPATERLVYQLLFVLASEAEAAWPTTLDADLELLKGDLPGRLRLAVEYRAEKKRVLTAFIAALAKVL